MVRPFPFLATCLMLLALAFYIIAASTAHWLVSYQPNVQEYEGVYNACWRQHDAGIDECRHVNNDCSADFSSPVDSFTLTDNCNELRAVRAFVVLSIIFAGLAVVALYLLSFTKVNRHSSRTQHNLPHWCIQVRIALLTPLCWLVCCSLLAALPESASARACAELPRGFVRADRMGHFHRTEQRQDGLLGHCSHSR